jgi:hypothetical protein
VAAVGGADADVARALWSKKSPGCGYNGNTTVIVQDTNPLYNPPYPSYTVQFERPTFVTVTFIVTISVNQNIPANALTLIQAPSWRRLPARTADRGRGSDRRCWPRGTTARCQALGSWAQIINIKIGCEMFRRRLSSDRSADRR